jgi:hypothetical protein
LKYSGRRGGGAALSLPVDARSEDTLAQDDFEKWIVKYIDSLFAFAQQCGLGIKRMNEIVLVTGFHRTKSWMNTVFLESQEAQVCFATKVVNADIEFYVSPEDVHGAVIQVGPQGRVCWCSHFQAPTDYRFAMTDAHQDLPEDQCIFIRGFRVARTFWSLRKDIKAAAGPSQDPKGSGRYSEPENEVIMIPATTKVKGFP